MNANPPTILIVDDESDLLTVLRLGLEAEGLQVIDARDGEEALRKARDARPDVMVLDLMLPRMDGYQVCRALKYDERYRAIPIIILSARAGAQDRQLALDMGADEFLNKPYAMHDLVRRVRAYVARAKKAA